MMIEQTLSIIKPDAVAKGVVDQINERFNQSGLHVIASKQLQLTQRQAEQFYAVHKDRPFYRDLVSYMTKGPVVIQVLEGEKAIMTNREVMGATDPKEAAAGTIRADFADSIEANAVHGSDSEETAKQEIAFFFTSEDLAKK